MATADKTYYLDENQELTDDQEKAAFVLINEGQEIPRDMADKYGIGKVAQDAEDEADKSVKAAKAPANKAKKSAKADKGAK